MEKRALQREFDALSYRGVTCDETHARAEHAIYEVLVSAYLFHRKVRSDPSFLQKKYAAEKIVGHKKAENAINFGPFLRVMFRYDLPNMGQAEKDKQRLTPGSQKNRVAAYKVVLDAFEEEWSNNADEYAANPTPKLLNFINENSMKGLVDKRKEKNKADKTAPPNEQDVDIAATKKALAEAALTEIKDNPVVLGSAAVTKPEQFNFNGERLTACICRINENTGEFEIIATSSSDEAIRLIAQGDKARLDQVISPALRILAEVVATQSFPSKHIPGGNRAQLTGALKSWYKSVYLESASKKDLQTQRRLVLRGRDIILSPQRTDSGVVTRLTKPKYKLVPKVTDEYYLKTEYLRTLEQWIEDKTIAARKSIPPSALAPSSGKVKYDATLTVANRMTDAKEKLLHFYNVHRTGDNRNSLGQAEFDASGFKPMWQFTAKRDWLMLLRSECLDGWFKLAASGKKLKREENSLFEIAIKPNEFAIGYELDATGENPVDVIELRSPATIKKGKSFSFSVSSKDLAPVLYNIADLAIIGDIRFAGDAAAMTMQFETELGAYTIAVPAMIGDEPHRDPTHFKQYAARGTGSEN